jgi:glycerol kinase
MVEDSAGVYVVPAFAALGAPYWDMHARGTITGLTRGSNLYHIIRASLESIAYQSNDLISAMNADTNTHISTLKVDGGASRNNLLMQFQADVLGTSVIRPQVTETTALGAAYLAGLAVGYWESIDHIKSQWAVDTAFSPEADADTVEKLKEGWADAIERTLSGK